MHVSKPQRTEATVWRKERQNFSWEPDNFMHKMFTTLLQIKVILWHLWTSYTFHTLLEFAALVLCVRVYGCELFNVYIISISDQAGLLILLDTVQTRDL